MAGAGRETMRWFRRPVHLPAAVTGEAQAMTGDRALRLEAIAALVDPVSRAEEALARTASADEQELAGALRGGPDQAPGPDAAAVAALLRLAAESPAGTLFKVGLSEAFLPDGGASALSRPESTAALTDLFRRLLLPGLDGDARDQAAALLDGPGLRTA